jgi:formylglycine-generating enzyme required for sulfatase activity
MTRLLRIDTLTLFLAATWLANPQAGFAQSAAPADAAAVRKAVSFYASFDTAVAGDVGRGGKSLRTRFDHATTKGAFDFEPGFDPRLFTIARDGGVHGGALQVTDVMPRRGRVFFPAKDNLAYRAGGWGGAVSFWLNTDPNTSLKTPFCDPVQITEKGANDGGLWCDFPDRRPRDFRLGAFPAVPAGTKGISEDAADAPLVRVERIGFKVGEWHHVVLSWERFDSGKADATAVLYIDGKEQGRLAQREIAMRWNLEKTGIYLALSYIGLLDEFAVFDRFLSAAEVKLLQREPGLLAELKTKSPPPGELKGTTWAGVFQGMNRRRREAPPAAPKFPFNADEAAKYQREYATWLGAPLTIVNEAGQEFVLIPPGKFLMGSPPDEPGRTKNDDEHQFPIELTQAFYLARHETTLGQFRTFVEQTQHVTDGEKTGGGHAHDERAVWEHRAGTHWRRPGYAAPVTLAGRHPVVHVSHADSLAFCGWLNAGGGKTARYTLPTEAEWEWACRAGAATRFWWGGDLDTTGKVANVGDQQLKQVHPHWPREIMAMNDGQAFLAPVGSYRANGFGLHDMLGNVWEFCGSRAGKYPLEATINPSDLAADRGFAVRGGGWSNLPHDCRCATRNADPPHFCHSNLGFRVAIKLELAGK